jgi:hypothetical protein
MHAINFDFHTIEESLMYADAICWIATAAAAAVPVPTHLHFCIIYDDENSSLSLFIIIIIIVDKSFTQTERDIRWNWLKFSERVSEFNAKNQHNNPRQRERERDFFSPLSGPHE